MSDQKTPKPYCYKGNTEYYRFTSFKDAAEFARKEARKLRKATTVISDTDPPKNSGRCVFDYIPNRGCEPRTSFWLVVIKCSLEDRIGSVDWENDTLADAFDNEQTLNAYLDDIEYEKNRYSGWETMYLRWILEAPLIKFPLFICPTTSQQH